MTERRIRPFLPYLVAAALHLVLLYTGPAWAVTATKALLMPLLVLAVFVAVRGHGLAPRDRRDASVGLLVGALSASWVGDVLLSVPGTAWFVGGLLGFLVAHVAYLVLFVRLAREGGRRAPRWYVAVAFAAWYAGFLALLAPHLGVLFAPVAGYGLVLGAMAAFASTRGALIAAGGVCFVVSDSVLALGRFLPGYSFALHDLVVMTTYLAAQGLIAFGVVRVVRASAPSSRAPGRPVPATAP